MRAAILSQLNAPLELRDLQCPSPSFGQVLVRMTMAGLCGAQLQEIRGEKGNAKYLPHLLGHEGCGIVEAIGEGVKTVAVGDKVVCHWMKGEGMDVDGGFYLHSREDSVGCSVEHHIGGGPCHTFATHAILSENRVTAVPSDTPDSLCCLLGCALSTALGVCENEAQLKMGERVLVIGLGGVGSCIARVAKIMGAEVKAIDNGAYRKTAEVAGQGWYCIADWQGGSPPDIGIFDKVIDTSGNEFSISVGSALVATGGTMVLVGQPKPGTKLSLYDARHLFDGTGKTIKATQGGRCNPTKDFHRWINAFRSGHLRIDGIISHEYPFEHINQAIETLKSGKAGRVMLKMPG